MPSIQKELFPNTAQNPKAAPKKSPNFTLLDDRKKQDINKKEREVCVMYSKYLKYGETVC